MNFQPFKSFGPQGPEEVSAVPCGVQPRPRSRPRSEVAISLRWQVGAGVLLLDSEV